MVDVLQTYMQDAMSLVRLHRAETGNHDGNHGITDYGTKLRATEKQRLRNQYKEQEKDALDRLLYHVKESKASTLQVPQKSLKGLACQFCAPMNSVSVLSICLLSKLNVHCTHMTERYAVKLFKIYNNEINTNIAFVCQLHVILIGLIIRYQIYCVAVCMFFMYFAIDANKKHRKHYDRSLEWTI